MTEPQARVARALSDRYTVEREFGGGGMFRVTFTSRVDIIPSGPRIDSVLQHSHRDRARFNQNAADSAR